MAPKSKETFEQAKEIGLQLLSQTTGVKETAFVLIGDSLHRDIKFGNQAGFITVYKPSAFEGFETPNTSDEQPCYTIKSLEELPSILREDLGLMIQTLVKNRFY
jgi:ribonucleotide monophosphatase NagD (HAD superfamily)